MSKIEQDNRAALAALFAGRYSVRIDSGEVYVLGSGGWLYFGHINAPGLFA